MTTQTGTPEPEPPGGTALLLIVSLATIVTVAGEAVFIRSATWTLLPLAVLGIICIAAVVVSAVGRLIDDGEISASARRTTEPVEAQPAPSDDVARARPVLGH